MMTRMELDSMLDKAQAPTKTKAPLGRPAGAAPPPERVALTSPEAAAAFGWAIQLAIDAGELTVDFRENDDGRTFVLHEAREGIIGGYAQVAPAHLAAERKYVKDLEAYNADARRVLLEVAGHFQETRSALGELRRDLQAQVDAHSAVRVTRKESIIHHNPDGSLASVETIERTPREAAAGG